MSEIEKAPLLQESYTFGEQPATRHIYHPQDAVIEVIKKVQKIDPRQLGFPSNTSIPTCDIDSIPADNSEVIEVTTSNGMKTEKKAGVKVPKQKYVTVTEGNLLFVEGPDATFHEIGTVDTTSAAQKFGTTVLNGDIGHQVKVNTANGTIIAYVLKSRKGKGFVSR